MNSFTKGKCKIRGLSLLEITVATVVLGALMSIVFAVFRSGIVSLRKVENQSALVRELQLLSLKMSEEVRQSNASSLSVSPDGAVLSFLSARDTSSGEFQLDDLARPEWQHFIVYYYDSSSFTIQRLTVEYLSSTPTDARTLESYSGNALIDFVGTNNPQLVARDISRCRWEVEASLLLRFEFETEKKRYQRDGSEKKGITGKVYLRN